MESLFKLTLLRPVVELDSARLPIRLRFESAFQTALAKAFVGDRQTTRAPVRAAAQKFVGEYGAHVLAENEQDECLRVAP